MSRTTESFDSNSYYKTCKTHEHLVYILSERHRDIVSTDHTVVDDGSTKTGEKELGILKYNLDGKVTPNELYRPVQLYGKPNLKLG